jgi:hypothetical protein
VSSPSAVLGILAALSILITWFLPVARRAGSIRTLRDLIHERYVKVATAAGEAARGTCVYCGDPAGPTPSDIVPRSIHVSSRCASCDVVRSIDNQVPACDACSDRTAGAGVYEALHARQPGARELDGGVPLLVERRYLKTALRCLGCAGVLDTVPKELSVHAVDEALRPYCP